MGYENERITFAGGEKIVIALAAELVNGFGLKKGDKVGIAMRNLPEFLLAFLDITYMGGVAVPLNALWKTEEFEYAVKDSGMGLLIADPERLRTCMPFMGSLGVKSILCRGASAGAAAWDD